MCVLCLFFFFFFQAEDGIRDLVRSRGLGDVYKRQVLARAWSLGCGLAIRRCTWFVDPSLSASGTVPGAVSYTHLTLPTSDLV